VYSPEARSLGKDAFSSSSVRCPERGPQPAFIDGHCETAMASTDPFELLLFYLCGLVGAFLVVGGFVLLYKGKISLSGGSEATEIKTPLGTLRTNIPALVLFALALVPLIYPLWRIRELRQTVEVVGVVKSTEPDVEVLVVRGTKSLRATPDGSRFALKVPQDEYSIGYRIGDQFIPGGDAIVPEDCGHGQCQVTDMIYDVQKPATTRTTARVTRHIEDVPADFGRRTR
jgi:hypothetical protein